MNSLKSLLRILLEMVGVYPANFKKYERMENFEKQWSDWIINNRLSPPPPPKAKHLVMERYHVPGAIWLETGTFRGETARFLAGLGSRVITLEPSEHYFQLASQSLAGIGNVQIIKGSSEEFLDSLLKRCLGESICFWLDGHWSGEETWQGAEETPILHELAVIEKYRKQFPKLRVLIDDYRLCWNSPKKYPNPNFYINWAEKNQLNWFVEQDIFIATSSPIPPC